MPIEAGLVSPQTQADALNETAGASVPVKIKSRHLGQSCSCFHTKPLGWWGHRPSLLLPLTLPKPSGGLS